MQKNASKIALIFSFLLVFFVSSWAQNGNPFELQPRLSPEEQVVAEPATAIEPRETVSGNPFEIEPRLDPAELQENQATPTVDSTSSSGNPFDISAPSSSSVEVPEFIDPPVIESTVDGETETKTLGSGTLLAIIVGLLVIMTLALLFFRELYGKIYRSLFNDNLLSQLYREREAGSFGEYLITYLLFFISGGVFLSLTLQYFGYILTGSFFWQVLYCSLGLMAIFIAKHLLLALLGFIFPLHKVIGRYSFMIMAFSIILGLVLAVGSTLLAYSPERWHGLLVYGVGILLILAYAWRSIRGLFHANHLFFSYPFHFLSYICAIEIGPMIVLFKLLTRT